MKLSFDARDHFRCQELAIGVQDEQIARPIEDDASARPVFVFIRPYQGAQGGIQCPVTSPLRPCFVMPRAVGQTIAVRLGLVQRTTCGEQLRFAFDVCTSQKIPTCGVSRGAVPDMLSPGLSLGRVMSSACCPGPAPSQTPVGRRARRRGRAQNSRKAWRLRSRCLTVFSAIAEEGDDAVGPENGLVRPCGHGAPARASASSSRMAPRLKSTPASSN
jgi:hypothetical protein